MAQLHVTLLGAFQVRSDDGRPVRIETRKARALLAALVMAEGRPVPREQLAGLLWSRGGTRQSLASLSQALYSIKRAAQEAGAPDVLVAEIDSVAVDRNQLSVDAWDVERAAAEGDDAGNRRCIDLHGGAFLGDLAIEAEEAYSEWRASERSRIEGLVASAGTTLMTRWEQAPEDADAATVDRLLAIDPYNEPAVRVRMLLLARDGRSAAAIGAGEDFAALLSTDLGIAPSPELTELVGRIRSGAVPATARPANGPHAKRRSRRALLAIPVAACILALVLWYAFPRGGIGPADGISLLVRPFDAGDGVAPGLAQGFADDLATELVRRSALDVLSRESGRLISDDAASGASHVLRGRVRSEDDQWVLNLWITETGSGREVWADRFRGSPDSPRSIRDEIVARISDRVGVALLPRPDEAPVTLPAPAVPAYLTALGRLHSGTPEGNATAIAMLRALADEHPEAAEPVAALVLAYERVAFEADDFARAAGLHWLEGYLLLKRELAATSAEQPDILAARARLALRRRDHVAAQALARRAMRIDAAHAGAHEVLALSLALIGAGEDARQAATRAITLSPATAEDGYLALALAAIADGDRTAAQDAVAAARELGRGPSLQLLALRAAILGIEKDETAARAAFDDLVSAVESRPFGAWRIGDVDYSNPRAATWRRPSGAAASRLLHFADEEVNARLASGLARASGQSAPATGRPRPTVLTESAIEDLLFNRRIAGRQTWLVQGDWSQTRSPDGTLFQSGAFGPLPAAKEGTSHLVDGRLCDRWTWKAVSLESCQVVLRTAAPGTYELIGETGAFPFVAVDPAQDPG